MVFWIFQRFGILDLLYFRRDRRRRRRRRRKWAIIKTLVLFFV